MQISIANAYSILCVPHLDRLFELYIFRLPDVVGIILLLLLFLFLLYFSELT